MNNVDEFIRSLGSEPIQIQYERFSARKILSGQSTLPIRLGQGLLNKLVLKEGDVLNGNIEVGFHPYNETLFFHTRDRLLVEAVLEIIRHKYDELTSSGLCIKPIYSRPNGYTHQSGNTDNPMYTYELEPLLIGKTATLPYYLYMQKSDGTHLAEAVPVLARRVSIHIHGDVYLHFKPNNISVQEILDICKLKYDQYKPKIFNTQWGLNTDTLVQKPQGRFKRTLNGLKFSLADLLDRRSFLPIHKVDGKYCLSQPIELVISETTHPFDKQELMSTLWSQWQPVSSDTPCICDDISTNLCVFKADSLIAGIETLPSLRGIVLKHRSVVIFSDNSVLCYRRNTLIQDILWQTHRILKSNDPITSGYRFIHRTTKKLVRPEKVYKNMFRLMEECEETSISINIVLLLDTSYTPLCISSGTSLVALEKEYKVRVAEMHKKKNLELSTYKMWRNESLRAQIQN